MQKDQPSGYQLYLLLWRAQKALTDWGYVRLGELELGSYSEYAILETLFKEGAQPVNTIGRKVMLTSGSITAALDRLEQRGWLKRKASPNDRRVVEVHLTPKGRKVSGDAVEAQELAMEKAIDSLSTTEKNTLRTTLGKLIAVAEAQG
ncbi:MAG: MarR family transcriptional regulator [Verrucomicrobiota bacterium]|nr:MarR family transcriptional regulator [Verrucomicrobiota bacterium]